MEDKWKIIAETPISGINRHDHYAAAALQGLLSGVIYDRLTHESRKRIAEIALMCADAMIDAMLLDSDL